MGYYTSFKLDIEYPENVDEMDMEKRIATFALYEWEGWTEGWAKSIGFFEETEIVDTNNPDGYKIRTQTTYGLFSSFWSSGMKWYEHEAHMLVISNRFPDVLFTLRGEGEDPRDLWIKYFKGGKIQIAKAHINL